MIITRKTELKSCRCSFSVRSKD